MVLRELPLRPLLLLELLLLLRPLEMLLLLHNIFVYSIFFENDKRTEKT